MGGCNKEKKILNAEKELYRKNGTTYEKKTNIPFTGISEYYVKDDAPYSDSIKILATYEDGIMRLPVKGYYKTGEIKFEVKGSPDLSYGKVHSYYKTGKRKSVFEVLSLSHFGRYTKYYENGVIKEKGVKKEKQIFEKIEYNPNGSIKLKTVIDSNRAKKIIDRRVAVEIQDNINQWTLNFIVFGILIIPIAIFSKKKKYFIYFLFILEGLFFLGLIVLIIVSFILREPLNIIEFYNLWLFILVLVMLNIFEVIIMNMIFLIIYIRLRNIKKLKIEKI
jgi:hypothetical protein